MSEEKVIIAIASPNWEKIGRLREVVNDLLEWLKKNEPGTLDFAFWEVPTEDGVKLYLYERYASQAALDAHEASDEYTKVFKTMTEEQLVLGPPVIVKGKQWAALRR